MFTANRRFLSAAIVVAVLGAGLAGCARTAAPGAAGAPARTASSPAATSAPAPSITPTPTPTHATPPRASAAGQLAGFFAAAQVADGALRHAAVLVNQGVGKKTLNFSPEALAAVKALDTSAVARAIPAGLPPELLRRTLLVYSDLVSRHLALDRIWEFRSDYPMSMSGFDGKYLYRCMGNGATPAARFGADLAAARSLAGQTPPVTRPAPDSRAAAELALRINLIELANGGCMSCGGSVSTTLSKIVWQPEDESGVGHSDGYINGIRFRADYHPGHGWSVAIWAC
jgi:hypothetical protein